MRAECFHARIGGVNGQVDRCLWAVRASVLCVAQADRAAAGIAGGAAPPYAAAPDGRLRGRQGDFSLRAAAKCQDEARTKAHAFNMKSRAIPYKPGTESYYFNSKPTQTLRRQRVQRTTLR